MGMLKAIFSNGIDRPMIVCERAVCINLVAMPKRRCKGDTQILEIPHLKERIDL